MQQIENGMYRMGDLVWIVDTHTGDGHHTFNNLADVMQYIFAHRKDCAVVAVSPQGKLMFQTVLKST